MRRLTFLFVIAIALLSPLAAHADQRTITIDNFVFTPKKITVPAGTKLVWLNRDDIPHTIVGNVGPKRFKSPPLDTNDKFAFTFDQPGTYQYFCSIHPMMTGTITVQ
jgi:plastocyanin